MSGITDSEKLTALQTDFKDLFSKKMVTEQSANYSLFTVETPMDGTSLEWDYLSNAPVMKEWIGQQDYSNMRANVLAITAKDYSKGTAVSLLKIKGDRTGLIGKTLAGFLANVVGDKDKLATAQLVAGLGTDAASIGPDGVSFFSTAHPNGAGGALWSNTGTDALSRAAFKAARVAFNSQTDENGEPLNVSVTYLQVHPTNEDLARDILAAERGTNQSATGGVDATSSVVGVTSIPNSMAGYNIKLVINKRLGAAQWIIGDDSDAMAKPIVMGILTDATPETNVDQYSEVPEAHFRVRLQAAIGFGAPQLAWMSNP